MNALPPATPEKGGDEKAATNAPNNKHGGQPTNEFKPSEIPWQQIFDFGGTGLVFWVWAEIIHYHDFLTLCFLGLTLTVFQAGPCHFIYTLLGKSRRTFKFSLILWLVLVILTWSVVCVNTLSPSELKPHPHFTFSLLSGDGPPYDELKLTNDFILSILSGKQGERTELRGFLFIPPKSGRSNVLFRFSIKNDSEVTAEDSKVVVDIPKTMNPAAAIGWNRCISRGKLASFFKSDFGVVETNEIKSWAWNSPYAILAGDGVELPILRVTPCPDIDWIGLMARAKDSPAYSIQFRIFFANFPTNNPSLTNIFKKPFVALKQPKNGHFQFTYEELEKMQK